MSISNPPLDNLSPFNPVKFGSFPTLTVDYLDSLFLSKRNITESVSPETIFQNLLKVSNILPNTNNAHTIGTALLKMLGVYTTNLYTDEIVSISQPYVRFNTDIRSYIGGTIQASNIDVNNLVSQSTLVIEGQEALTLNAINDIIYAKTNLLCEANLIVPNTCYLQNIRADNADPINIFNNVSMNTKNLISVGAVFANSLHTQSPFNVNDYSLMPYTVCERMAGASYNLPSGPAGSNISFKGVFSGYSAWSVNVGASYDITYVITLTNNINSVTHTFICAFAGIAVATIPITINEMGTLLLTFKISFQVTAGTSTTASLLTYSTLKAVSTNSYQNSTSSTNINITGLSNGFLTPSFFINTPATPPQWSGIRRDYSFIRKY